MLIILPHILHDPWSKTCAPQNRSQFSQFAYAPPQIDAS